VFKRVLIFLLFALICYGCTGKDLHIKIKYDKIEGLQQGARVLFEKNHIGDVTGVSYREDGSYLLDVAIRRDFAAAATNESAFIIIMDPREKEKKAIEMIRAKEGGRPLQNGVTVNGTTRSSLLFGKVRENFDTMLQGLKGRLERFTDKLREIPNREEFKRLEREMQGLADELKEAEKAVRDKINKEILPRLKEELNNLRERLRELGREKEIEPLEVQIEKIKRI
jgi:paraquat-inducible protein B